MRLLAIADFDPPGDRQCAYRREPTPMDIEWAKDGVSGELFIVQARPETVHSRRAAPMQRLYELAGHAEPLVTGLAIGDAVASARARVIRDPRQIAELLPGEILITEITDPDWEPVMNAANPRGRGPTSGVVRRLESSRARHDGCDRQRTKGRVNVAAIADSSTRQ